ncbi:diacylglycerol kinase family protein [Streptomyces bobili]|uniref:diacylglycerol/lipid kinase family protein n=1 Tax=Streptomyces bobili TaxID=67280 RepID=UPI0037F656AC
MAATRGRTRRPARPNVSVPALPAGLGLIAVVNSDAGGDIPAEAELRILLPMTDIRLCASGVDLHLVLDQAAKDVLAHGGALGVVGGDGTVNAAAVRATESGLPLAVFPVGTLNHFAADLGLATLESTADAVEAGRGGAVDLGRVTAAGGAGTYFLNTFGIGVYPELVRAGKPARGAWASGPPCASACSASSPTEPPARSLSTGGTDGCGCSSPATAATTRPASRPPTAAASTTDSSTSAPSTAATPSPAPVSSPPSSPAPSPAPASTRPPRSPGCGSTE